MQPNPSEQAISVSKASFHPPFSSSQNAVRMLKFKEMEACSNIYPIFKWHSQIVGLVTAPGALDLGELNSRDCRAS
ncbi:hypothetical protein BJP36_24735 [Moorena producens JHB]|uniref:Uncharacterized protein n=1 Tax=Moorena producens (strain JHB) TaxID=1454205 RepID=A0A1D9G4W0_MOOP1|nr:hypothetical protein [Moorena producens]AOY82646.1 hypothetical protein BJP36_24735 [Moorena producens JHB]